MTDRSPFSVEFSAEEPGGEAVRFSCKEMFDVAGFPATCGHPRFAPHRATRSTSAVVTRLQRAGARLVGKTLQSELAMSGSGINPHCAMPPNPIRPNSVPGGSSTGCAVAVAGGHVDLSLCTDTAGSARIPAACCDVIGVALAGQERWLSDAVTLSDTLDQLGVIASEPSTLRWVLEVLEISSDSAPVREVVVPHSLLSCCSEPVRRAFSAAVERIETIGVLVHTCETAVFDEVDSVQLEDGSLALAEIAARLAPFLEEHREEVSPEILERLEPYLGWSIERLAALRSSVLAPLKRFRREWQEPILLPTLPMLPPPAGVEAPLGGLTRYSNLLGESSITVPLKSLDTSIMVIGPHAGTLVALAEGVVL